MKAFFYLGLVFLFILVFLLLPRSIAEYRLSLSGETVMVEILRLPDCNSSTRFKNMKIRYEGNIFIVSADCRHTDTLRVGQSFEMLHKADTDLFLFKDQHTVGELIANILLIAGCLFYLLRIHKIGSK